MMIEELHSKTRPELPRIARTGAGLKENHGRFVSAWSTTRAMNSARYGHTASVLRNGTVLVSVGFGSSGYLNSSELYDPWTGVWRVTGAMNTARYMSHSIIIG